MRTTSRILGLAGLVASTWSVAATNSAQAQTLDVQTLTYSRPVAATVDGTAASGVTSNGDVLVQPASYRSYYGGWGHRSYGWGGGWRGGWGGGWGYSSYYRPWYGTGYGYGYGGYGSPYAWNAYRPYYRSPYVGYYGSYAGYGYSPYYASVSYGYAPAYAYGYGYPAYGYGGYGGCW